MLTKRITLAVLLAAALALPASLLAQPPDGGRPQGARPGMRGPGGMPQGAANFFASEPMAKTDAEKKAMPVLQAMVREGRGYQSVPMEDGRFLRLLAEAVNAQTVVEIGTSQGFSSIWFCIALRQTGGKLTTYEIDEGRWNLAKENFKKAGVDDLVDPVLGDAHEEVAKFEGEIDILFLDADKDGYIDYLNKLLPKVKPGGLVVAHNITPQQADPRYLEAITKDENLETLLVSLQASGISVSLKKR
ncbi:MAG: putative O-methyltransferase [candidate division BRC1 bacterium ADurb.BinA364]|nr:MAG: putative O-methyltransferase [candidate division BRC1 bacterium ADurb.BinA364]